MKKLIKIAVLVSIIVNANALSIDKVIYGNDDRIDYSQMNEQEKSWSDATAAMILKEDISKGFFLFNILGITRNYKLRNMMTLNEFNESNMCKDEKFIDQITSSRCTGFLIKEDVLVTAGHCVTTQEDCDNYSWVFGYTQKQLSKGKSPKVMKKNVYNCKEIMKQQYGVFDSASDYAVIKLNKKVKGRKPFEVDFIKDNVKVGDEIAVIGTPTGLPVKYAGGAVIRSLDEEYFSTNLDTFGGNSGSPVISKKSGKVIGILVRGETDYEYDFEDECYRTYNCDSDDCRGEDVTFITELLGL